MHPITFTRTRPILDDAGLDRLGAAWRGIEAAAGASPFQRWSWVGCRAAERYPSPLLAQAHRCGKLVGLALFNRCRSRLWLHESGDPALDSIYIEHNGPLALPGPDRSAVLAGLLRCALGDLLGRLGGVVLSGVGSDILQAARDAGAATSNRRRAAPFVDLGAIPAGTDYPAVLSRNTRQQLRRSARAYGDVRLDRAATGPQALEYLDALAVLHTASWQARGKPGAFARPEFLAFHRGLAAHGAPAGEVDLLRITAGTQVVGYLYNLRACGRVCSYQGGFDYAGAPPHGKPGLLCHYLAIEAARVRGDAAYDFLAGDGRYKDSLSNAEGVLHWLRLLPRWHPLALTAAVLGT
ncbi:MAG: GNAT family N-acetyltransferase [Janthinobacterium lividum]